VAELDAPEALEAVPAGHDKHVLALVAPKVAEYVPAPHSAHACWPVFWL
jgi:hypothetical protein